MNIAPFELIFDKRGLFILLKLVLSNNINLDIVAIPKQSII
jgi:hypothetical protein